MLEFRCHCGQISVRIEEKPSYINECNCTLCTKAGARWSYFAPSMVHVQGAGGRYRRRDKADPAVDIHFCQTCGSTTHFTLTESGLSRVGKAMIGVNMSLADEADLAGTELRYPDGRNWAGEGPFAYIRAARVIGDNAAG